MTARGSGADGRPVPGSFSGAGIEAIPGNARDWVNQVATKVSASAPVFRPVVKADGPQAPATRAIGRRR